MIPQRVAVRGFLSYRDEQSLDFAAAPLWMLSGANGSGKSAIFDAVTYALFGWHRSGGQDAVELVNKECDGFAVEFEFSLGGEQFQIRRTLKRSQNGRISSTQQIAKLDPQRGHWIPEPETNKKRSFDAWIQDHLGLRYETFTASVLLLQGQAERLLSHTPAERFKVLADVVDLQRYIRLHGRVDEQRRELKAQLAVIQSQLEALPSVSAEEWAGACERHAVAEAARAQCDEATAALRTTEMHAQRWAELNERAAALADRCHRAEAMLREAEAIERSVARLHELNRVIPLVEQVLRERGGADAAKRALADLELRARHIAEQLTGTSAALEQSRRKLAALAADTERDTARRTALSTELFALIESVTLINAHESSRQELARAQGELRKFPADLDAKLAGATALVDELSALQTALSTLKRLQEARSKAPESEGQAAELDTQLKIIAARGEELTAEIARLEPAVAERHEAVVRLQAAATAAQTLARQAKANLDSFRHLKDAQVCSQCGQALTVEHRHYELQHRTKAVEEADHRERETANRLGAATAEHAGLTQQIAKLIAERDQKREEYRTTKHRCEQTERDAARWRQAAADSLAELPESLRHEPRADFDWNVAQRRATELPSARAELARLRNLETERGTCRGAVATLEETVARQAASLPGDPAGIRRQHSSCEAEIAALAGQIAARQQAIKAVEGEIERLVLEQDKHRNLATELAGRVQGEQVRLETHERSWATAIAAAPEEWREQIRDARLADQHAWKLERDELVANKVEQKLSELQLARAGLQSLLEESALLEDSMAKIPDDARRPMGEVAAALRASVQAGKQAATDAEHARDEVRRLENLRRQRDELLAHSSEFRKSHGLHERLADLLGRDGLQRTLVRRAERQIVDYAAAVLDRLSGGELHLRLRSTANEDEKALDMEVINSATSTAPIPVALLSGSQRFRVAVSLALGIGRFASGKHRPIESVIIDEGFGCLDRIGRHVMIQELQNLRDYLKRILLVSHQEEFADAFSDGYHFELVNGATRVTRFHR